METASFNLEVKEFQHSFRISIYGTLNIINVKTFKDIIFGDSFRLKNIILNLKGLDYIDSSGIGFLFAIIKLQRDHRKDIKLDNINSSIQEILEVSGLLNFYREVSNDK